MFDAREATKELRKYEKRGARGATGRLLDAVRASLQEDSVGDFTHLDIGGGVGVLQHELVESGASRTTAVDASRPYLELLRTAAEERGYASRQVLVEGDFTEVAGEVAPATVVTLDKVICCYPDMPALVSASAQKATVLYGVVVPRAEIWVRFVVHLANWFIGKVLRRQFEMFTYPLSAIDRVCAEQGLTLARDDTGLFLSVRIYRRSA